MQQPRRTTLPDKTRDIREAIARIPEGASVMVGGFGVPGTPFTLIRELVRHGVKGLTIIKNDCNEAGMGIDWLLQNGQIAKLVTTHIGLNPNAVAAKNEGRIEVEFVPQGILAERIRAAGAGLMGFVTDIGMGTPLAEGKERIRVADGREGIFEHALRADFALLHSAQSDPFGNLRFAATARNFTPLMAMAAQETIVETEMLLQLGGITPDDIHLPGNFIDHVVKLEDLPEVYGVVQR